MSDNLEKVEKGVEAILTKQAEFEAQVKAATERAEAAEAKAEAIAKAHQDGMSEVRALLEVKTSAPEAKDLMKGLGRFAKAVHDHQKRGVPMPAEFVNKAAADHITTVDATAGFLVPDYYQPLIYTATEMYGNILPMCRIVPVPAGVMMPVNRRSTNPVVAFGTQGAELLETEYVYAQDTVTPMRVGAHIKASNEMMAVPGTGYSEDLIAALLQGMVKMKEWTLFQGDSSAGAYPSDGILVETGPSDQANLASTVAGIMTFIQDSVVDNAELDNADEAIIVVTPGKRLAVLANTGITNNNGLAVLQGKQLYVGGFPVYSNPGCLISTTHWATMFKPKDILCADPGTLALDFNSQGTGWASNETWVRIVSHFDHSLKGGDFAKFSKADFT